MTDEQRRRYDRERKARWKATNPEEYVAAHRRQTAQRVAENHAARAKWAALAAQAASETGEGA